MHLQINTGRNQLTVPDCKQAEDTKCSFKLKGIFQQRHTEKKVRESNLSGLESICHLEHCNTQIISNTCLMYRESESLDIFLFPFSHHQCPPPTNRNMERTRVPHHQLQVQLYVWIKNFAQANRHSVAFVYNRIRRNNNNY